MIDTEFLKNISIRKIHSGESIPYQLLLDADPSCTAISKYLESSEIHIALLKDEIVASIVCCMQDADTMEIKNIAVKDILQGRGIGQLLLETATRTAVNKNVRNLIIGTSNSSVGQLYLYQKAGFEMTEIKHNFFLDNYPEPIFENGIQCRHMIMLKKII